MLWSEPATADDSHAALEKTLWGTANQFWSNAAVVPPRCGKLATSYFSHLFSLPAGANVVHWIQHFHSALNKKGRAGFVMANSTADGRAFEQRIREKSSALALSKVQIDLVVHFAYAGGACAYLNKVQNLQSHLEPNED